MSYVPFHCRACFNTGIVLAERIGSGGLEAPYAFRCDCSHGSRRKMRFPLWSDERSKKFTVTDQQVWTPKGSDDAEGDAA